MIDWSAFDAVLFDLDGVLTDTARIHTDCWKQTFDDFLRKRAEAGREPFRAFDPVRDYRQYVDGKPRYDGVRDFLRSRGIELPEGSPADPPDADTVCGVGNRKNALVVKAIQAGSVDVYEGSLAFVRQVRDRGLRTAVVSSSANAGEVLAAGGIADLFDLRVDGAVAAARKLPGKPAPDTFLEAARELGVPPERAVVVEDAVSGVEAGRAGGFGLVIGVARHDDPDSLRRHGAGLVVSDLRELVE